jgi:glycosyltransferase involved in cell wall biosynthesis
MRSLSNGMPKSEASLLKILFIGHVSTSWVGRDFELLCDFHVETLQMKDRSFPTLFKLLRQFISADIIYVWFIKISTFIVVLLSVFLGKKTIIVTGGFDIAEEPEINYGQMLNPLRARMVKFVLKNADRILPFSDFAKEEVLKITKNAKIDVVPLSCDTERFQPSGKKKQTIALTVCAVNKSNIIRKGLETFLESARLLPEVRFVLVGRHADDSINYLRKISPSNVEFIGYVSEEELIRWYQRAKVYCQLSYQEGFGVAVIEAMACECVPVVSLKAVVLRETVGDCGFYVPYGDAEATVKAIKTALSASLDLGAKARKRVKDLFSVEKRQKNLLELINDIYAHK